MPIDPFFKVSLGTHKGSPAVVLSDRTGKPFLWCADANHLAAIKRMRAFCDAMERDGGADGE